MAVRPVLVCDICGADGGTVRTYRLVYPDGTIWEAELCPKQGCGGQLEAYRKKDIGHEVKGRGRRRTFEVTSLDSVKKQAAKRTQKRP